jgi:hypothetical protein
MKAIRAIPPLHEPEEAPPFVYTQDTLNFKVKTWTWSDPGPMASAQHAERKEVVGAAPEFDDADFQARWWPTESCDWDSTDHEV